jgi:hypothetical protein
MSEAEEPDSGKTPCSRELCQCLENCQLLTISTHFNSLNVQFFWAIARNSGRDNRISLEWVTLA